MDMVDEYRGGERDPNAVGFAPLDYAEHPLELWRKRHGRSKGWMCDRLKCSDPTYYKWTVARDNNNALVPRPKSMRRIYVLTDGEVEPNHFYAVNDWKRQSVSMMQANTAADLKRDIARDKEVVS